MLVYWNPESSHASRPSRFFILLLLLSHCFEGNALSKTAGNPGSRGKTVQEGKVSSAVFTKPNHCGKLAGHPGSHPGLDVHRPTFQTWCSCLSAFRRAARERVSFTYSPTHSLIQSIIKHTLSTNCVPEFQDTHMKILHALQGFTI